VRAKMMEEKNQITQNQVSDRDVIEMIRAVYQNQVHLIALADQKANILIGIVSVVFSILFSSNQLINNNLNQWLSIPFFGFIILEMIATLLGLLTILPRQIGRSKKSSIKEVDNPMFFGNFIQFKQEDVVDFLLKNINNDYTARSILISDLYQMGIVLKNKYTLLRYAYIFGVTGVFFLGLTILLFYCQSYFSLSLLKKAQSFINQGFDLIRSLLF
jgi:hypothetical protein